MPINYKAYGPDWPRISQQIRTERAGNRCECCGVPNHQHGYWVADEDGDMPEGLASRTERYKDGSEVLFRFYTFEQADDVLDKTGLDMLWRVPPGKKMAKVILTVAHLNHDITNHSLENLKALCQWCHLAHDRRDNHRRRRYGKKGQFYQQQVLMFMDNRG